MFLKPEYRRVFISKTTWRKDPGKTRFSGSTYLNWGDFPSREKLEAWLEEEYDKEQRLPLVRYGNTGWKYLLEDDCIEREGRKFFFLRAIRAMPGPGENRNQLVKAVPKERIIPLTEAAVHILMGG